MIFVWLVVIVLAVFLDQVTKYIAILFLEPVGSVPLWKDVLHLTYVENTGAAFGMLKDQRWIFLVISTVAIVAILGYMIWKKPKDKLLCLSLSFIVGGGIGNMIDRLLLGYVVDFIDCAFINFPVFNIADCFVTVGAGIMMVWAIWSMVLEARQSKQTVAVPAKELDPAADAETAEDDTTHEG